MKEKLFKHKASIFITFIFVITLIGFTFAYFTLTVTGEGKEVDVTAANKVLTISGNTAVDFGTIVPGWSDTVTISIKNDGDSPTYYNLVWSSLTNGFTRPGDITMNITSTNSGGSGSNIPMTSSGNNINILSDILINTGVTQTYTITFTYANLPNTDQTMDSGASFSGVLGFSGSTKSIND